MSMPLCRLPVVVLGLCLSLAPSIPSASADPDVDDTFWSDRLAKVMESSQRLQAVVPPPEALPLTYAYLVIDEPGIERANAWQAVDGVLRLGATLGALVVGATLLHQVAERFIADASLVTGGALALGGGIVADSLIDLTVEDTIERGELALELRREQLDLADELRSDATAPPAAAGNSIPYLLERIARLDRGIAARIQEGARTETLLYQYAQARALFDLADAMQALDPVAQAARVAQVRAQSARLLEKILAYNPESSIALDLLGRIELRRYRTLLDRDATAADPRWRQAVAFLERARSAEPANHGTYLLLARAFRLKGDTTAARSVLKQYLARQIDHQHARARVIEALGETAQQAGHPVAAFLAYRTALQRDETTETLRRLIDLTRDPEVRSWFPLQTTPEVRAAWLARFLSRLEAETRTRIAEDPYYDWADVQRTHQPYYEQLRELTLGPVDI